VLNVVCLKWGSLYGPEYVNRLFYAVRRHLSIPFSFHCFTDDSTDLHPDVVLHPLPHTELHGWWNKLYLFSKEVNLTGRVMFIDLDTLITANIDDLATTTGYVGLNKLRPPGFD